MKTYYAQLYHEKALIEELCATHAEHPDARFVIVGFEYGALPARGLARRAVEKGLPLDLVVYLQPKGSWLGGAAAEGVGRTIVIQSGMSKSTSSQLESSEIVDVSSLTRYGVPTHPNTLARLADELAQLAGGIPITNEKVEPFPSMLEDPAPSPRPITVKPSEKADDWDFLKPLALQSAVKTEKP